MPFREMLLLLPLVFSPAAAAIQPPVIDGVIDEQVWQSARRESLQGGGEVRFLRDGAYLHVAVRAGARGFPSLCIGDADRVDVLHASAALGHASYLRKDGKWQRVSPFAWRVRDRDGPAERKLAERQAFEAEHGWLANASRDESPIREFRITVGSGRRFVGVVFLNTQSMQPAWWPHALADGCRDAALLRGDAPASLEFDPARWHPVD